MLEELVIFHCSPTMAGMKTGSLFTCPIEEGNLLTENIRQLNSSLVPGGIRMLPVKYMGCKALIYMYRPEKLAEDFKDKTAKEILEEKNYPVDHVDRCVVELVRRLKGKEEAFPHEIGLFLGYPPKDVAAFMKSSSAGVQYVGTWKVYSDVETAKMKFAQYRECTKAYCEAFRRGHTFDRLIVNCS
ncbi:MAG: DUF3793 family protein [Lachnospiraceae bacterium]|nr:DUF3793 family protein [Lachnospiraceae bacterium]